MITVNSIVRKLKAGELRDHVFASKAAENFEHLNILIANINSGINDLNAQLVLKRKVTSLVYNVGTTDYQLDAPDLEKVIAIFEDNGREVRYNSSALGMPSEGSALVAYSIGYNELQLAGECADNKVLSVHYRAALQELDYADSEGDIQDTLNQLINLPKAMEEALVLYCSYKVLVGISPSIKGDHPANYVKSQYDQAVGNLRIQGFGTKIVPVTTDTIHMNSHII